MHTVARGEFHPSARSCAWMSTLISPRSYAASVSASRTGGVLLRDQLLGRGHADVDRLRERADRGGRLLAERGVRLVADHELVRLAAERADVSREPGVRLDRQRVRLERLLARLDRVRVAVAVALRLQVALELRDEQAAVREDEDPERTRSLDEACRGDRLARGG